jgi:hypothetical protein
MSTAFSSLSSRAWRTQESMLILKLVPFPFLTLHQPIKPSFVQVRPFDGRPRLPSHRFPDRRLRYVGGWSRLHFCYPFTSIVSLFSLSPPHPIIFSLSQLVETAPPLLAKQLADFVINTFDTLPLLYRFAEPGPQAFQLAGKHDAGPDTGVGREWLISNLPSNL